MQTKRASTQVTVCLKMYSHLEERRERVYTVLVSVPKSFSARLAPPGWVPTGLGQCLLFHGCCMGLSGQTEPGITATSQPLPSGPLHEHSQQLAATLAKLCSIQLPPLCMSRVDRQPSGLGDLCSGITIPPLLRPTMVDRLLSPISSSRQSCRRFACC